MYLIGTLIDNKRGLCVAKDNLFFGSESLEEAISMLPNYKENHARGYEASMSACIHQLTFGYHVLQFDDLEEIANALESRTVQLAHNVSGRTRFVLLKPSYSPKIVHSGKFI